MSTARREYFLLVTGLVLLIVTGAAVYYIPRAPSPARDAAEIRAMVTAFGGYEKSIPLQGNIDDVKREIQQNYSAYATDALLQEWRADPLHAPGRLTASTWPDSIAIDSISPQGAGYVVSGHIIMMTLDAQKKDMNAGEIPVVLQVIRDNGTWKIAAYQKQVAQ